MRRSIKRECFEQIGIYSRLGRDEDADKLRDLYHNIIMKKNKGVSVLGRILSEN